MLAVEVEWKTAEWSRSTVQHGQTPFVNRLISPERHRGRGYEWEFHVENAPAETWSGWRALWPGWRGASSASARHVRGRVRPDRRRG
jgi:hypothetical protein